MALARRSFRRAIENPIARQIGDNGVLGVDLQARRVTADGDAAALPEIRLVLVERPEVWKSAEDRATLPPWF
jgi:hypothetical protein